MRASPRPALELVGLVKRFGETTAVDHVELTVPPGSFFGLVGPNGAGKTTSLSMAVGLLRPKWFALLPVGPRRLAAGLLGASLVGFAPLVTLVASAALVVAATRFGVAPVLAAVPATLLQVVLMVVCSRVVVAALGAALSSRRGQELGGLLMAVIIALASGGWSLAAVMGQQLATGPPPTLATALRVVPSGWAPVAVAAAARSDWTLVAAALGGLLVLSGLLVAAWAKLLPAVMRRPAGAAGPARGGAATPAIGRRPGAWQRLLPGGPTGAVVVKELHTWRRDPGRTLLLLLALLISGLNLAVPAVAFDLPAGLVWVGPAAALMLAMGAANLYGEEGTALWLTRMVPGTERADVRGRQAAWLLVVAPIILVLTVVGTVPAAILVQLGTLRHQPVLQATGVVAGTATGVVLCWWGGRSAARRLADRGAELLDLLHLGPQALPRTQAAGPAREPARQLSRPRAAARGILLPVGILCIVPQGLVPIGFNLFGVDPQVKVWFAARYLPQRLQIPAAAAFIVAGALAVWWATAIQRTSTGDR